MRGNAAGGDFDKAVNFGLETSDPKTYTHNTKIEGGLYVRKN